MRELQDAAARGVEVRLILQGQPDMPIAQLAARTLYHHLIKAGVGIYEYCERPMHGKVALVDDDWSTVGSSNLDPLSLALNLEANVVIRGFAFNGVLSDRLTKLIGACRPISFADQSEPRPWRLFRSFFVFHFLRWYPSLASRLPSHRSRIRRL